MSEWANMGVWYFVRAPLSVCSAKSSVKMGLTNQPTPQFLLKKVNWLYVGDSSRG
jgi:hypothetical protein